MQIWSIELSFNKKQRNKWMKAINKRVECKSIKYLLETTEERRRSMNIKSIKFIFENSNMEDPLKYFFNMLALDQLPYFEQDKNAFEVLSIAVCKIHTKLIMNETDSETVSMYFSDPHSNHTMDLQINLLK